MPYPRRHHDSHLYRRLSLLRHQSLARLPQHLPPHLKLFNRTKHPILSWRPSMPRTLVRAIAALFAAALLLISSSLALDTPLSDQAVREAYFLGQRHDGSLASFLGKYIRQLPPPQTGPYISSISFFILLPSWSSSPITTLATTAR